MQLRLAREHIWIIGVNRRNAVKYIELCTLGTLTESPLHPREVFRLAIIKGVSAIFIVHNHPSDTIDPSEDDLNITRKLVKAGEIIGINILDHVIIGTIDSQNYYSFSASNLINKGK